MSSTTAPARRRGLRAPKDDGPRASFRQLLPYLAEHKVALGIVVALGLLGAAASLAQPVLVGQVITLVQNEQPLGWLVWGLVALVIISAVLSAIQHYLLQR